MGKMRRLETGAGILLALLLLTPALAAAQGRLRLGPVRLFPSFSLNQEYTSNFFLLRDEKNSNFIFTQTPQIVALFPMGRHFIQGSYRADFIEHARFNRYNRVDHSASALFSFDFPEGYTLKAFDSYLSTAVPPDFNGDRDLFYNNNTMGVEVGFRRPELMEAKVLYTHQEVGFARVIDRVGNYDINAMTASLEYRVLGRHRALAEFIFRGVNNRPRRLDNSRFLGFVGLVLDPDARLTGSVKVGFTVIDFDRAIPFDRDLATVATAISLLYKLTQFDDVRFDAARDIVQTSPVATLFTFGDFFVSTGFSLGWEHRFPEIKGLSAMMQFKFANDDYRAALFPLKGREDSFVQVGAGAAYKFLRFIQADFNYNWRQRDSNFDLNDYQEHRVLLKFTFTL